MISSKKKVEVDIIKEESESPYYQNESWSNQRGQGKLILLRKKEQADIIKEESESCYNKKSYESW